MYPNWGIVSREEWGFSWEKFPGWGIVILGGGAMGAMNDGTKTGFGERLKRLRDEVGWTQAQLAEAAGLHLRAITKLENGVNEPGWATVIALARALEITPDAFLLTAPPVE